MPRTPSSSGRRSLADTITAAVADLTEHGYDSSERVAFWQGEIKKAAEASMASEASLQEMLNASMAGIYRRLVDDGGIMARHPGISRFTLEKLRPQLQAQLRKRIMVSADLIKLNRQQSIAKTLQRFSGWASSVPVGGSKTTNKTEEKASIKKALSSLPFEERRVLIDQGHKLAASISETIAQDGGALAVVWHSHFRQPGYNFRPDHKHRDGHVYLLRKSWARTAGLVKPDPSDGCYEDITSVAEEPFCRCYATYVYNLRDLPPHMLTDKGRAELARVQKALRHGS